MGNQDSDKRRTYAFARQSHRSLRSMLFVDRDEWLFCPSAKESRSAQAIAHAQLFRRSNQGVPRTLWINIVVLICGVCLAQS